MQQAPQQPPMQAQPPQQLSQQPNQPGGGQPGQQPTQPGQQPPPQQSGFSDTDPFSKYVNLLPILKESVSCLLLASLMA